MNVLLLRSGDRLADRRARSSIRAMWCRPLEPGSADQAEAVVLVAGAPPQEQESARNYLGRGLPVCVFGSDCDEDGMQGAADTYVLREWIGDVFLREVTIPRKGAAS